MLYQVLLMFGRDGSHGNDVLVETFLCEAASKIQED